jgi:hypothetical protein
MEMLLDDVQHFRSDLFLDYGNILNMPVGDVGIVLTRKCGSEFYTQGSQEPVFDRYECWKREAVNFYFIRRIDETFPLCKSPAVIWECIDQERADRLMTLIEEHYRYIFYTPEQISRMLRDLKFADYNKPTDIQLERMSEEAWESLSGWYGDATPEYRYEKYLQVLERIAEDSGLNKERSDDLRG